MGVGYQASALHRILYLVTDETPAAPTEPPPELAQAFPGVKWGGPAKFRSTPVSTILAWRGRLAEKYWSQLGETLSWDEESEFEASEDTFTGANVQFEYVAALVDERGEGVLPDLIGAAEPAHEE